jgi:hypothetical protein
MGVSCGASGVTDWSFVPSTGPEASSDAAVAQFDDTQSEIEAGNAALLQDAPFLISLLAHQATAPNMHPVSACVRNRE